jgi:hypothetical protein
MVRCILPPILALLMGCAAVPLPPPRPLTVKVPVFTPMYCDVARPPLPKLPLTALKSDSAPGETMRAYVASVILLKGAVEERDALLGSCRPPSDGARTGSLVDSSSGSLGSALREPAPSRRSVLK